MISLEQIRTLDERVKKAVQALGDLKSENQTLKQKLADYQKRIEELEKLIDDFKKDQGEIEQGILNAISQLETLEAGEETESSTAGGGINADRGITMDDEPGGADTESTGENPAGPDASEEIEAPEDDSINSDEKELDIF